MYEPPPPLCSMLLAGLGWADEGGGTQELKTCSPDYYEHTQRLFLLLHKHGLAYRAESLVNWDPVDMTVLANEQVSSTGHSWRSGAVVEKKMLEQWFFRITEFREALLEDLGVLKDAWPKPVRVQQENWIGKSVGAKIRFLLQAAGQRAGGVDVFTTRVDTLCGVQYLALAATHPIVARLAERGGELARFVKEVEENRDFNKNLSADGKAKRGFLLPGVEARNPIFPDAEPLPVFIAEYVLDGYGEGAVMGVPGHDTRDHAFWKENCPEKEVKLVIRPKGKQPSEQEQQIFTNPGVLMSNCGEFSGMTSKAAQNAILEKLSEKGWAEESTQWRLRDWLVSRQRYWGTPIPMVHCESCGVVPVKEEDLPVKLPEGVDISGKGGSPLASVKEWVETTCPECGGEARRDTDTMDTFVDSSWYYMRFTDPQNKKE